MGWWGKYIYNAGLRDIKQYIEEDTGMKIVKFTFSYAVCVMTKEALEAYEKRNNCKRPDLLNFIVIALWRKSKDEVMVKQVDECMGPCYYDVPLKYVNAPCEASKEVTAARIEKSGQRGR